MFYFENSIIHKLILHQVGNKQNDEDLVLSYSALTLSENLKSLLLKYFLNPFKTEEYWQLYHDTAISLNEVYSYVSAIFANPNTLYDQSVNLAKHLYEKTNHPKIKGGEFYTVFIKDCILEGEFVDAIGLFKSENKDTFLKVINSHDGFALQTEKGININKLDKGCLIFNTERDNGYVVAVVDNTNNNSEAQYWINDFLHLRQRQNEYYNTDNVLSMCKTFVTNELPQHFEVSKADQVDLLNKSVQFFKDNENFYIDDFTEAVIQQPDIIDSFKDYRSRYQGEREIELPDSFDISESAVKKQARAFKSVIKLDKNFHIYIHGDSKLIEQGEDEKGKFYKMYFQEEM